MVKLGRGERKRFVQIELRPHRRKQIPAPNNFRHAHERVIDHHRKLIREIPVSTANDKISAVTKKIAILCAKMSVNERNVSVFNHKPFCRRASLR